MKKYITIHQGCFRFLKKFNCRPELCIVYMAYIGRAALMLNFILTNKKIARQGYITLLNYHEVRHLAWVHHKKGLPLRQVLFACLFLANLLR